MLDRARFERIVWRVRSRWFDYAWLRKSRSVDEILGARQATARLQLFNRNAIRARVVQGAFDACGCDIFVETGTFHAATTIGARLYLGHPVVTCENSPVEHYVSRLLTLGLRGVSLRRQDSRAFVRDIAADLGRQHRVPFFYLDAHEGALDPTSLPLMDEVRPILDLACFVALVDDMRVPEVPGFKWGTYGETQLEIGLLARGLAGAGIGRCFFPAYSPTIETGHVSGYCLFWRSARLDNAYVTRQFPFNLLRAYDLASASYLGAQEPGARLLKSDAPGAG